MRKLINSLVVLSFCVLVACSSMDGDAKKAAQLNKKSIEYVRDQDLEKAEQAYKDAQEIINRYKNTEQYNEFYSAYQAYMSGEKK